MASHYIALIHKASDSAYGVSFPDLLGVTTVADTLDDALREASVALAFALEDCPRASHIYRLFSTSPRLGIVPSSPGIDT